MLRSISRNMITKKNYGSWVAAILVLLCAVAMDVRLPYGPFLPWFPIAMAVVFSLGSGLLLRDAFHGWATYHFATGDESDRIRQEMIANYQGGTHMPELADWIFYLSMFGVLFWHEHWVLLPAWFIIAAVDLTFRNHVPKNSSKQQPA